MMAEVGDSMVVSGIRMAIADDGPIPGSTPTKVPMVHPKKAQNRLPAPKADANP